MRANQVGLRLRPSGFYGFLQTPTVGQWDGPLPFVGLFPFRRGDSTLSFQSGTGFRLRGQTNKNPPNGSLYLVFA